jgi:hypothetical protein
MPGTIHNVFYSVNTYCGVEGGGHKLKIQAAMSDLNTPAGRLKTARIDAGYSSAAEFASANGLVVPTYRSHENGARDLSREAAKKYSKILGVTVGWLLNAEGPTPTAVKRPVGPTGLPDDKLLLLIEGGVEAAITKRIRSIPLADKRDFARIIFNAIREGKK